MADPYLDLLRAILNPESARSPGSAMESLITAGPGLGGAGPVVAGPSLEEGFKKMITPDSPVTAGKVSKAASKAGGKASGSVLDDVLKAIGGKGGKKGAAGFLGELKNLGKKLGKKATSSKGILKNLRKKLGKKAISDKGMLTLAAAEIAIPMIISYLMNQSFQFEQVGAQAELQKAAAEAESAAKPTIQDEVARAMLSTEQQQTQMGHQALLQQLMQADVGPEVAGGMAASPISFRQSV